MTTKVLMISGAGRSGSTLVERLTARAHGVVALGEVIHLWDRGVRENQLCGCGSPFHDCAFWQQVGELAFGGWHEAQAQRMADLKVAVDKARYIPRLRTALPGSRFREMAEEYGAMFARIYQAAEQVSGAEVLVDSSKQVSLPYLVGLDPRVSLRVLNVVRDPRGVAYSWTKEVNRPEIQGHDELMPQYSPSRTALWWIFHNAGLLALPHEVPQLRVRHEDLVRDPAGQVQRIARFAGTAVPAETLDGLRRREVRLPADHTVAGNPMRFKTGMLQLRQDSDWRRSLPGPDRRKVTTITWPWLLAYGYRKEQVR